MSVTLELTDEAAGRPIRNLFPLYLHDLSAHQSIALNEHGVHSDEGLEDLAALADRQRGWWQRPGVLFPYLIRQGGLPVGFDLIAARQALPAGLDADFVVHEFFVARAVRGTGVAEQAALEGFARHRGRWEVVTEPANQPAIRFWRRVLERCCPGAVDEAERDHPWGRKRVWRFDNR